MGAIGALGLTAIGVVDAVGAPTDAQTAPVEYEVVSAATDGAPLPGQSTGASVSDDGSVVVFANVVRDSHQLVIRTRPIDGGSGRTDVVYPGVDESSETPVLGAVSGDGCAVAYSVVVPAEEAPEVTTTTTTSTTTTTTVATDGGTTDGGETDGGETDGASGTDGSTDGASATATDGGDGGTGGGETGGVDATDGGGAGTAIDTNSAAAAQTATSTIELRLVDRCVPAGTAITQSVLATVDGQTGLAAPALSADGSSVAWPIGDEIRVYSSTSTVDDEVLVTVRSGVADDRVGDRLDLSADGRTLVFESGAPSEGGDGDGDPVSSNVYIAALPAATDAAGTPPDVRLLAPSRAGSSGPSMSSDAAFVIYESDAAELFADAPAEGPYLVVADRSAAIADPARGATSQRVLTTGATDASISNDASAVVYNAFDSVRVRRSDTAVPFEDSTEVIVNSALSAQFDESVGASISTPTLSADGELAVFAHVAGVDLSTDAATRGAGHVWSVATTEIFAPPTTTPDSTSTTTAPVATIPVGTAPPTVTTPRNTTRNTTRTTTRTTNRATTTTTGVVVLPSFDPAAFEFAPTIAAAGRRTAEISFVNPTDDPVTVTDIAVEPASDQFTVEAGACQDPVDAGERCAVSISFAPTVEGEATANLVATLGDGTTATSALRGLGAPAPTLAVLPGVASNGQVVSVFGSGFPAGAIVEFSWNRGQVESNIVIDESGGFTETLLVLPNTVSGPVEMKVAGQTDLFGETTASVLVSGNGGRGATALIVGGVLGR